MHKKQASVPAMQFLFPTGDTLSSISDVFRTYASPTTATYTFYFISYKRLLPTVVTSAKSSDFTECQKKSQI